MTAATLRRVAILDDHVTHRLGLSQLLDLQPDLEVVASSGTYDDLLAAIEGRSVDVVVCDLYLTGRRPYLEVITELSEQHGHRVLVMPAAGMPEDVSSASASPRLAATS